MADNKNPLIKKRGHVVEHSQVGPHRKGEHVAFSDEDIKRGVDVERLLRIGAIREATEEDGEAVPYGSSAEEYFPFPAVPFESSVQRENATTVQEQKAPEA